MINSNPTRLSALLSCLLQGPNFGQIATRVTICVRINTSESQKKHARKMCAGSSTSNMQMFFPLVLCAMKCFNVKWYSYPRILNTRSFNVKWYSLLIERCVRLVAVTEISWGPKKKFRPNQKYLTCEYI